MYDGFKFKKDLQGVRVSKFEATRGPDWNSLRTRKDIFNDNFLSLVVRLRPPTLLCGGDCDGERTD